MRSWGEVRSWWMGCHEKQLEACNAECVTDIPQDNLFRDTFTTKLANSVAVWILVYSLCWRCKKVLAFSNIIWKVLLIFFCMGRWDIDNLAKFDKKEQLCSVIKRASLWPGVVGHTFSVKLFLFHLLDCWITLPCSSQQTRQTQVLEEIQLPGKPTAMVSTNSGSGVRPVTSYFS